MDPYLYDLQLTMVYLVSLPPHPAMAAYVLLDLYLPSGFEKTLVATASVFCTEMGEIMF